MRYTIILLICTILLSGCNQELEIWGKETKGLVARIWTDKTVFGVGEQILVHYQVKNVSQNTQILWQSGFWPNQKIIVLDGNGKDIPVTDAGKLRREAFSPGGARDKNVEWPLAPGTIDNALPTYNLREFFVLDTPGEYSIQYLYEEYQGGWEGKLWSNVITIEIIK